MRPVGRSLKSHVHFVAAMMSTLALAAAVLIAPAARAESASPSPAASPGGTAYRVGTLESVETLNPFLGYSVVDNVVYLASPGRPARGHRVTGVGLRNGCGRWPARAA